MAIAGRKKKSDISVPFPIMEALDIEGLALIDETIKFGQNVQANKLFLVIKENPGLTQKQLWPKVRGSEHILQDNLTKMVKSGFLLRTNDKNAYRFNINETYMQELNIRLKELATFMAAGMDHFEATKKLKANATTKPIAKKTKIK